MKVISILLKTTGCIFILLAVLAFGSNFLPAEGINIGGQETGGGSYEFYKIVPVEGVDPIKYAGAFLLLGVGLIISPVLIQKIISKKTGL